MGPGTLPCPSLPLQPKEAPGPGAQEPVLLRFLGSDRPPWVLGEEGRGGGAGRAACLAAGGVGSALGYSPSSSQLRAHKNVCKLAQRARERDRDGGLSTELKDLVACVAHHMAGRPRVRGRQDEGQEGLRPPGRSPATRPAVPHAAQWLWLICQLPASSLC